MPPDTIARDISQADTAEARATPPRKMRITALDRTRGFAVLCMIMAHFGPGIYDRVGLWGTPRYLLELMGRLATPMFVLIFGITLGIVYMPRAIRDPAGVRRALIRRSGLVLLCSLVVVLPATVSLFFDPRSNLSAFQILLRQYSVLTFYAVAIFVTGLVCRFLANDPWRTGLLSGSILIFVGSFLGYDAWAYTGETDEELLRLLFVSGKYGVFTLLGCAWMMLGMGDLIRQRVNDGVPFRRDVVIIAVAAILVSLSVGRIVGWRTVQDLALHYDAPPQLWFLLTAGGVMLIALAVLDTWKLGMFGFVLEHIGRNPLTIYLGHAFVLPAIAFLRKHAPFLPQPLILALCLGSFLAFCAFTVYRSARTSAART